MRGRKSRLILRAIAGFTLIEFTVAIVVLGILAAVAIPRFVNMANQARATMVIAGAKILATAASMVNLKVCA